MTDRGEESSLIMGPREFFREKVARALSNQKVDVCDEVEFYLVNLLCGFVAPEKLKTALGELDLLETPLALLLKHAIEAPPSMQLKVFKVLGDTSLYMSGYFQDYFNRKTFDLDYYIAMGSQAYSHVAGLMRQHQPRRLQEVYVRLSDQFPLLVEVVAEVSEQSGLNDNSDLLALYDRWCRNQSERLRKKLMDRGIDPIPANIRDAQ